jgi:hypothetical protein
MTDLISLVGDQLRLTFNNRGSVDYGYWPVQP